MSRKDAEKTPWASRNMTRPLAAHTQAEGHHPMRNGCGASVDADREVSDVPPGHKCHSRPLERALLPAPHTGVA